MNAQIIVKSENGESVSYSCNQCGKCCISTDKGLGVVLYPTDYERLSAATNLPFKEFANEYCNIIGGFEREGETVVIYDLRKKFDRCIFLSNDNTCSIYENRPEQCRRAPLGYFWDGSVDPRYECLEGIEIPASWNTEPEDLELVSSFFEET